MLGGRMAWGWRGSGLALADLSGDLGFLSLPGPRLRSGAGVEASGGSVQAGGRKSGMTTVRGRLCCSSEQR